MGTSAFDSITATSSPGSAVSVVNTTGSTTFGDQDGNDLDLATTTGTADAALLLSSAGTVVVPNGAATAQVSANGGPAIDVTNTSGASLAFDTVSSTSSTTRGINIDGGGSFTAGAGSISGSAGVALRVNGGSGDVTYPGTIGNGSGDTASISGRTGGTIVLSGNISDSSDAGGGISLSGNTGGTTTFSGGTKTINTTSGGGNAIVMGSSDVHTLNLTGGGLDIDTTTGKGLEAVNSGTVNVSGSNNTIDTTTGTALNIGNTDVGASGMTFVHISSNGAANGVKLDNTGPNSALTVTGSGGTCTAADTSGCSGGAILNTSGADDSSTLPVGTGVALRNTRGVSLTRMRIAGDSNYGIRGSSVNGLTIANSVINGTNGTSAATANKDSAARFNELTGTVSMTDTEMSGGYTDNLLVNNTLGTLSATLTNFRSGTLDATGGDDAVQFEGLQLATMNVTVQNSTFTTATGDVFQYAGDGSGGGTLNFTGNGVSNNEPSIANAGGGVTLTGGGRGNTTLNVQSNTFRDSVTSALTIVKSREVGFSGNVTGTISGNQIGAAGQANSGSLGGSGIAVTNFGAGNQSLAVTGNTIRQYNSNGMSFTAGAGIAETGQLNLGIANNTVTEPGTNPSVTLFNGIRVNSGVTAGDAFATCVDFGTNSITGSSDAVNKDWRLLANNSPIRLPGYSGTSIDDAAVVTFVNSKIGSAANGTAARGTSTWSGGNPLSCP
jgi:hypothetical protein